MLCLTSNPGYRKIQNCEYICVRTCYYISLNEEVLYAQRFLEFCEMIYVTNGEVHIVVAGHEYTVGNGEVIIIPCYLTIDGIHRSDKKSSYYSVEFTCSDGIITDIEKQVVSIQDDTYYIEKLFSRMNNCLSAYGNEDNFEADALLLSILYVTRSNIVHSERGNESVLQTVMDYINEHIDTIMSIDTLAAHFGYNKDYLLRIFRDRFGITIKKYINDKKLTMVKRLLVTTDMPMSKISASIGFENIELFEKYFKYHEKVTPQRYRKINR